MLANIDFTIRYQPNPPSPPEDLKWVRSGDGWDGIKSTQQNNYPHQYAIALPSEELR